MAKKKTNAKKSEQPEEVLPPGIEEALMEKTEIPEYLLEGDGRQPASMVMRLLSSGSAQRILDAPEDDLGLAEHMPYPFMALVGQLEMRMALLLSIINPNIGGVLLIGPRGTGKTTAARGLSDLLPFVDHSNCIYGCMPADYEAQGRDGVCDDCYEKIQNGEPLTRVEPVHLLELPLNARLEDVVGGVNERIALSQGQVRIERGLLARADQNLLYVDEVNLLSDEIVDAILDASAQGQYTVRRGPIRATYRSRFVLIGSMNPEEGRLRPQILDRFGLRVIVRGLHTAEERMLVYNRVKHFRNNPRALMQAFELETESARDEVLGARELIDSVDLDPDARTLGLKLIAELQIDSHRAEFTMFEAARAYAAADLRETATLDDLRAVAPMALRMRRSDFIDQFVSEQQAEDQRIFELLKETPRPASKNTTRSRKTSSTKKSTAKKPAAKKTTKSPASKKKASTSKS